MALVKTKSTAKWRNKAKAGKSPVSSLVLPHHLRLLAHLRVNGSTAIKWNAINIYNLLK